MGSRVTKGGASRVLLVVGLLGVAAFAFMPGCSSNNDGGGGGKPSGPQSYEGTVAGPSGESGVIDVTIAGSSPAMSLGVFQAATVQATGTLTLVGSAPISLTGNYDTASRLLHVSGGLYTFDGQVDSGHTELTGTYTGPSGTGSFAASASSGAGSVTVYCGTYTGTASGVWNLSRSGSTLVGSFSDSNGASGVLSGSVSGSTFNITYQNGTATGTVSGSSVSGTWQANGGASYGTFSGSTGGCSGT